MVLKNYWMELSNKCKSNKQERFNYIMSEINKLKETILEPDSSDKTSDESTGKTEEDEKGDSTTTTIESKNHSLVLKTYGKQTTDYTEGDKGHFKFIIRDNKGEVVEGASILVNGVVQEGIVSDSTGKVIVSDYDFNATGEVSIVFTSTCEGYFDSDEVTLICTIVEVDEE